MLWLNCGKFLKFLGELDIFELQRLTQVSMVWLFMWFFVVIISQIYLLFMMGTVLWFLYKNFMKHLQLLVCCSWVQLKSQTRRCILLPKDKFFWTPAIKREGVNMPSSVYQYVSRPPSVCQYISRWTHFLQNGSIGFFMKLWMRQGCLRGEKLTSFEKNLIWG